MLTSLEKIDIYISLFKGREDVFASRWEKDDKSGYSPVFTDYSRSAYRNLSDADIESHLRGNVTLGVYPLLADNTSYFVAADFDKKKWQDDVRNFCSICDKSEIPVYVEISRSGNGAHVWCFFDQPYSAHKSRKIFLSLLREANCIDEYAHDESFDRLFPNQDMHSGKGLGNLIALPLQGQSRKQDRTVFVNGEFDPHPDQWSALQGMKRMHVKQLDELFMNLPTDEDTLFSASNQIPTKAMADGVIHLEVANMIRISRNTVPSSLVKFLRENLSFLNSEYFAKSRSGFSVHTVEKYFKTVMTDDEYVYVPRGCLGATENFLHDNNIEYTVSDKKKICEEICFDLNIDLYVYQQHALKAFEGEENGILIAPPGSGKTIMGLAIAAQKKQPTLIITHRRNISQQWVESIENVLHISKKDIGRYDGVTKKVKSPVTVAMIDTLARSDKLQEILDQFGCVIIDECHHVPAKTFRKVISQVSAKYLYGQTATPKRKHNDGRLIDIYLGETIHTVSHRDMTSGSQDNSEVAESVVTVLESTLKIPYDIPISEFSHIHKLLSYNIERNTLIADSVMREVASKRQALVLCDRKEHVESLRYFLKDRTDVLTMTGDLSAKQKKYRMTRFNNGTFQVVLATGQLFGEGVDIEHFDSLFLVSPISSEGKLVQYMGRLRSNGNEKRIFDIRDKGVEILEESFKKRLTVYKRLIKTGEITRME